MSKGDPKQNEIESGRLEAFSDGVLAVIITIMVLELHPPAGGSLADLKSLIPKLMVYVLSFSLVGIYWNNHHHLLRAVKNINANVMWANLHLLFWLSLTPFVTAWVGEHPSAHGPAIVYGLIGTFSAAAYFILTKTLIRANTKVDLESALGSDLKGKISVLLELLGVAAAFVYPVAAYALYALVAITWFIPDRRLEHL